MANVTGVGKQNSEGKSQDYLRNFVQQLRQGMASIMGLDDMQGPRITGDTDEYDPSGAKVTTGGGGRGSGRGAQRATGGEGGGGGRGGVPVTGSGQRSTPPPSDGINFSRANLLEGGPLTRNLGRVAAYAPVGAMAVQDLLEGRPVEAAVGLGTGMGTAALVRSAGRTIGAGSSPRAKLIGGAFQLAAPLLGVAASEAAGGQAQREVQRATGQGDPTQLSTQLGQTEKVAELLANMDERTARTYVEMQRQLGANAAARDLATLKAQQPIIEQAQRNALVRQQALINTMGQNYAMLGTVATAGKLALGSQEEAGLNLRTALQANPYSNAVLSAPSISF
jgi:hypothetical protein